MRRRLIDRARDRGPAALKLAGCRVVAPHAQAPQRRFQVADERRVGPGQRLRPGDQHIVMTTGGV